MYDFSKCLYQVRVLEKIKIFEYIEIRDFLQSLNLIYFVDQVTLGSKFYKEYI